VAVTKQPETSLQAITTVANQVFQVSTAVGVNGLYAGDFRIRFGRTNGTAFSNPPLFRIEGSYKLSPSATDESDWVTLVSFTAQAGINIGSTTVSGTAAAGATSFTLTSNTNFATSWVDYVFIQNSTLANSEWKYATVFSGSTLTLQEGLARTQTGSTVSNQAEMYHALLDLTCIENVRFVCANTAGQTLVVECGFGAVSGL
jgi:hypothetical protein